VQRSLKRLCDLRQVEEDAERAALGRKRAHLVNVETAQSTESLRVRALTAAVHQELERGERMNAFPTIIELALAPLRRSRLEALAEAAREQVQQAHLEWLESRRRRLEVETLHAAAERERHAEMERLEQKNLDEWFLFRPEQRGSIRNDDCSAEENSLSGF
jgi:flagellar biosynthesis chaperone FliJ